MPRKTTKSAISGKSAQPQISAKLLEELIPGPVTKEQFEDIFQNFKKAFIERALSAEMSHHLGYSPGQAKPEGSNNHRNGSSAKTVITDTGALRNKAVYLALGMLPDGTRDILGIWIENTEGAKFWLKVFNDMKTRGCNDVLIAVTDSLKGMGKALAVVYPATTLQTCIVHLIRGSLDYASWKDRKPLAAAIKPIYTAPSAEAALSELDAFEHGPWGVKFPTVVGAWRRVWLTDEMGVIPVFAFPPEVRRVIYTTNAIESVNARLRKILKTRGHFPSDEAATKLIWLALRNITANWARASPHWKAAMNQFAVVYKERFTQTA
jgi:putative transposase